MTFAADHHRHNKVAEAVALVLGLTCATSVRAHAISFKVPEQDAATAVAEFARQANLQITAPTDGLSGVRTHEVMGPLDTRAALKQLLQGTGLVIASDDGHKINLRLSSASASNDPAPVPQSTGDNPTLALQAVKITALRYLPTKQSSATAIPMQLVDTPQAISVITPTMMGVIDAQNFDAATDLIPSAIYFGTGFGVDHVELRGVWNQFQMVNGIESNSYEQPLDAFALDRTELVLGPATAIYGVNGSFGGEVNDVLKRPLLTPEAKVGFETGSFDTKRYMLDITGPLPGTGGTLAGRFVAKYDDYGPGLDNTSIRDHHEMFLGSLGWAISDSTSATFWWYHDNSNIDPYDQGALFLEDGHLTLPPSNINPLKWYFSNPNESTAHTEVDLLIAELVHTFSNDDWQFKAEVLDSRYHQGAAYFYPFGPFGAYGAGSNNVDVYTYEITRHNGEITAELSQSGAFDMFDRKQRFIVQYEGDDSTSPNAYTLLNSTFVGIANAYQGGEGIFANGSPMPYINQSLLGLREIRTTDFKDDKLSTEILLNPVDRLNVLIGVLYQHSTNENKIPISGGLTLPIPSIQSVDYSQVLKRAGVVYDLIKGRGTVDKVNAYFNYSQGFEPQIIINKEGVAQSFPEVMTQYEAGVKGQFFKNAVNASLDAYNYTISNVAANDTALGQFGEFGTNVADGYQKAKGVEANVVGQLLPGWNVSFNYAYSDIRLTNPAYAYDLPIEDVPKHKGTIESSYEFLQGGLRGLIVGGMFVKSAKYALIQGFPEVTKWGEIYYPGYTRVDLNVAYDFHGKANGLELYANARNVFNSRLLFAKEGNPSFAMTYEDLRAVFAGIRYVFPTQ